MRTPWSGFVRETYWGFFDSPSSRDAGLGLVQNDTGLEFRQVAWPFLDSTSMYAAIGNWQSTPTGVPGRDRMAMSQTL